MIRTLILVGTILALGTPAAVVLLPLTAITGDATRLYNAAQTILRVGFRLARIRVETEGQEHVPAQTACIFMANHVSNLDPPSLLPCIPGRTSVFLKRSLMRIPVLGYGFKLGGFIPVARDGRVESAQASIAAARRAIEEGLHITFFVEGTRSPNGRIRQGTVHIRFHEPIEPGDYATREELMAAVRAAVASGLPEWMRR